ncbi:double-stranded RNA-binding protein Staufen homolog 2-like [Clytia hemisphaerica]
MTTNYQVVSETGPAHQKTYKVHLHVGHAGPFEGVGSSLKMARNAAASRALSDSFPGFHINPTVELNILSMKSREVAVYRELESMSLPGSTTSRHDQYDSLFLSQQYHSGLMHRGGPRMNHHKQRRLWRMSVTICGRTYIGEGHTKSEARFNAAAHALRELKQILLEKAKLVELEMSKQKQAAAQNGTEGNPEKPKAPCFVSKLHELANKHHMEIDFKLMNESGPPHVRVFHINCKVGDHQIIGQGIGKKSAKNDAAQKMLQILKELPEPEKKKPVNTRRQGKRKEKTKDSGIDPSLNAVSYLQCMMNMRKESPPVYTLKADAGPTQKGLMRFQIEASLEDFKAIGYGQTKKAAKTNSATNLLKCLGIDLIELRKEKGVAKVESDDEDESEIINIALDALMTETANLNRAPGTPVKHKIQLSKSKPSEVDQSFPAASAKQKVEYIARKEGFQVLYNDFVNGGKPGQSDNNEFSSSLAVFTSPPEVFHGAGQTVEASREEAARKAFNSMQAVPGANDSAASPNSK